MTQPAEVTHKQWKKRFGLIPARIGVSMAHKLGVAMPLEEAEYSTVTRTEGLVARTRIQRPNPHYRYETQPNGAKLPKAALPGATVYLDVQDISRLEPELIQHVKWVCKHPECAGTKFESKDELIQAHDDNKVLVEKAEQSPVGQAHVFVGVVEIAGKDAKSEQKGEKGLQPAVAAVVPTILLVSDEE